MSSLRSVQRCVNASLLISLPCFLPRSNEKKPIRVLTETTWYVGCYISPCKLLGIEPKRTMQSISSSTTSKNNDNILSKNSIVK